jgi:hypothetical protein
MDKTIERARIVYDAPVGSPALPDIRRMHRGSFSGFWGGWTFLVPALWGETGTVLNSCAVVLETCE